jgi:hypothetical protein
MSGPPEDNNMDCNELFSPPVANLFHPPTTPLASSSDHFVPLRKIPALLHHLDSLLSPQMGELPVSKLRVVLQRSERTVYRIYVSYTQ